MIDTPEVSEARQELYKALANYAQEGSVFSDGSNQTCAWEILKLRVGLLEVAVEHAARVVQIKENYENIKEHLK